MNRIKEIKECLANPLYCADDVNREELMREHIVYLMDVSDALDGSEGEMYQYCRQLRGELEAKDKKIKGLYDVIAMLRNDKILGD